MRLAGHTPLGRCRPFVSHGLELGAELFELPDGRRKLFLTPPGEEAKAQRAPSKATRIVYKDMGDRGNRARFLGMYIGPSLRGLGLAAPFVEFTGEHMEEMGLNFDGTERIHKPVLALVLRRLGFAAASTRCIAEIMPGSKRSDVAVIRFISNDLPPSRMVSGSGHHEFYRVAGPGEYRGVPLNEDRAVALHTRYLNPPDSTAYNLSSTHNLTDAIVNPATTGPAPQQTLVLVP